MQYAEKWEWTENNNNNNNNRDRKRTLAGMTQKENVLSWNYFILFFSGGEFFSASVAFIENQLLRH